MTNGFELFVVSLPFDGPENPQLEDIADYLALNLSDFDTGLGPIIMDLKLRKYLVRLRTDSVEKLEEEIRLKLEGPFSDPKVVPFEN